MTLPTAPRTAGELAEWAMSRGLSTAATWAFLRALELDPANALAWGGLARQMLWSTSDPLATLTLRYALKSRLDEPWKTELEAEHRMDLFDRGLLRHKSGNSTLKVERFHVGKDFEATTRFAPWIQEHLGHWKSLENAATALARMAGILTDAYVAPEGSGNPLDTADGWVATPKFLAFQASAELPPTPTESNDARCHDGAFLSDYWTKQHVMMLGVMLQFSLGAEAAAEWIKHRPRHLAPRAYLAQFFNLMHDRKKRDRAIRDLIQAQTDVDVEDLEESRRVLGQMQQWEPLIEILNRLDRALPDHPSVLANRGAARLEIGQTESGEKDLNQALKLDPKNSIALANLGLLHMRKNNYIEAREVLEKAVTLTPDQPEVRVYLAACKNSQDDPDGAIQELQEALRLDPSHVQARKLLDHIDVFKGSRRNKNN
jgi:Flp pilus assembly protein TadD